MLVSLFMSLRITSTVALIVRSKASGYALSARGLKTYRALRGASLDTGTIDCNGAQQSLQPQNINRVQCISEANVL